MDERQFENALLATLSEAPGDYTSGETLDVEQIRRVETFESAGMLTRDRGIVLEMNDGSEFQITIVKSR